MSAMEPGLADRNADAQHRAAALNPARSFIVQAPAGSGKTELLTQRLLVLLATVDEPEEVVAMTFTRKAAAERRHRVYAAVRRASEAPEPAQAHALRTWTLARAVLARSRARGWRLEEGPQRLRVLTIDALCAQIAQQAPLMAGFGGRIGVTDLAEPLYRDAARAVLASLENDSRHGPSVARVLRHFDNRCAVLEQQLVRLLGRRDQWLPLVTRDQRAGRPREVLEAALQWITAGAVQRAARAVPAALAREWLESATYACRSLPAEHPLQAVRDSGWPGADPERLPQWLALVDLVCTKDGSWRARLDARCGFPPGSGGAKAEAQARKQAHLELIEQLAAQPDLQPALQALRTLPDPRYSDAQWAVLDALLDTMRLAAAHLRLVFAARGEVDFAEVAARAVAALGDGDQPSELALRFDYRIRHLLVDEFQDTSRVQWDLLLQLTAGWSEGDGRTLFVVGDPMQSIYRFREADVGLYLSARQHGIGALRLQPLELKCNFRSQAGIVDWVNQAFTQVLPPAEDLNRSAVPYSAAVATHAAGAGRAVEVHAFIDAGASAEAQRVVEIVRGQRAADPQASIAVLVRSRGHLAEIAPALRAAGIDCRAVEIESLSERPVIEDLRALTWALLHPMDRVAWLAVLRAPWCGLRLADLLALSGGLPPHEPVLSAMRDPQRLARLSEDGRARLEFVLRTLDAAFAQQGRRPLRRWIEAIWLALGGPAAAGGEAALADAAVFFDCLQRLAPGAVLGDFAQLDLALAELKASAEADAANPVSLMTIHKSKGLEFDTVIVPGLGRGTRSDEPPPVAWAHLTDVDGAPRLLLAPVHATGDERDPTFDFVRRLEAEKQRFEDARLLYVAATRARRHLHLLGAVASGKAGVRSPRPASLLARLWPAVAADFETAAAPAANLQPAAPSPRPPAPALRRLVEWAPAVTEPGLPLPASAAPAAADGLRFDWAGETARCVGVVFHRWVQFIAEDGVDAWDASRCLALEAPLRDALRREGVPAARCAAAAARVLAALRATLADPRGRWLLDARHAQAVSELGLTAQLDGRLRRLVVDRSFVDAAGRRWIVDFKTSSHEGGDVAGFVREELRRYRPQLEAYCAAMRQLDARPVSAALYLPLIEDPALRWIELKD